MEHIIEQTNARKEGTPGWFKWMPRSFGFLAFSQTIATLVSLSHRHANRALIVGLRSQLAVLVALLIVYLWMTWKKKMSNRTISIFLLLAIVSIVIGGMCFLLNV